MRNRRLRNLAAILLRDGAGLSQEEAARLALTDRSKISRLENGEVANDELLLELIDAYGGTSLIDRLIDVLRRTREWYSIRDHLLYA